MWGNNWGRQVTAYPRWRRYCIQSVYMVGDKGDTVERSRVSVIGGAMRFYQGRALVYLIRLQDLLCFREIEP